MNTEQHAGDILQALKLADRSRFEVALNRAFLSYAAGAYASVLENEKSEGLQAIVEHLRDLGKNGQVPTSLNSCGALFLLRHLGVKRHLSVNRWPGPEPRFLT